MAGKCAFSQFHPRSSLICTSAVRMSDIASGNPCRGKQNKFKETRSLRIRHQRRADNRNKPVPVHSFQSLLADLDTFTRNTMAMGDSSATFVLYPKLTPVQERAFQLLDVPTAL
jgi:hypothetical protein